MKQIILEFYPYLGWAGSLLILLSSLVAALAYRYMVVPQTTQQSATEGPAPGKSNLSITSFASIRKPDISPAG